jgi:hypothetical protein
VKNSPASKRINPALDAAPKPKTFSAGEVARLTKYYTSSQTRGRSSGQRLIAPTRGRTLPRPVAGARRRCCALRVVGTLEVFGVRRQLLDVQW